MTENAMQDPNYYRNGYPADWTAGYQAGQNAQPGVALTVPDGVFHDAFVNGLQQGMNDAAMAAQQAQLAAQAAAQPQAQQFVPPVQQVAPPQTYTPPAAPAQPVQFTPPPVAQQPAQAFQQAFTAPPAQTAGQATSMLDQMAQDIAGPSAAQQAAQPPAVTSAGGFALLDGIEDELEQGSGEPFLFSEVGDQIVGYVRYRSLVQTDFVDQKTGQMKMAPLLDIEDRDGKLWSVRAYGAAFSNQIEKNDPHVGDGIAIRFVGMVQGKVGPPYKDVSVRVRRAN